MSGSYYSSNQQCCPMRPACAVSIIPEQRCGIINRVLEGVTLTPSDTANTQYCAVTSALSTVGTSDGTVKTSVAEQFTMQGIILIQNLGLAVDDYFTLTVPEWSDLAGKLTINSINGLLRGTNSTYRFDGEILGVIANNAVNIYILSATVPASTDPYTFTLFGQIIWK